MSRIRQRHSNSVPRRIFRKTLAVLLIIGIPVLVFISTFQIKKVDVAGENRYTQEQIITQVMQSKLDYNSLYLYLKYRFFSDVKMPFVEKIDVQMVDNHSVTIYVYEKMVAGCVEFMGEYLYFDKDGIVVESSSTKLEDVPIIKGLEFDKIILNEKLEVQNEELEVQTEVQTEVQGDTPTETPTEAPTEAPEEELTEVQNGKLFDTIINLTQLIEKYDLAVDTVIFNKEYEVTVECGKIRVFLGKKSNYDEALSELKNILTEAEGMDITIDMSNLDNIIATPNEGAE